MSTELEPDETADAVTVAYVNQSSTAYSWHHSMVELIGYDLANHGRILRGGYIAMRCGTDGLVTARNRGVEEFLNARDADWLFWIDTDMGFPADVIDQLLAMADPVDRPIVGALCFSQREGVEDGMGGFATHPTPTVYEWKHLGNQAGFLPRLDYPRDALVQVAGTGSACILIHRSALERIGEKFGTWYDRIPNPTVNELTSEDLSFCMRAMGLNIPIFVHTGVRTTHQKLQWVGEREFDLQRPAPPATEEVAVIVPVLRRPQNAAPFMRSLRASTGLATAYAVCDDDDDETRRAWTEAGAVVLDAELRHRPGTFAEKVNTGFRGTKEPWLLLVGDDVRFHPGWLDRALRDVRPHIGVIGTNDLSNPRVVAGEHSTHPLIRRSYIEENGASWDGPGVVCHEGFKHWFVDDEIVAVAKQRGAWRMAPLSVVEHLHPLFGKAADDEVYRLGQSHAAADKATFEKRVAEFGS